MNHPFTYAHEGNATDNAITIDVDKKPNRTFRAFVTEADFKAEQDRVWESSNQQRNLIRCHANEVFRYLGADGMEDLKNVARKNPNGFELKIDGKKIGVFPTRSQANDYANYSTDGYQKIHVVETLEKPDSTFAL